MIELGLRGVGLIGVGEDKIPENSQLVKAFSVESVSNVPIYLTYKNTREIKSLADHIFSFSMDSL